MDTLNSSKSMFAETNPVPSSYEMKFSDDTENDDSKKDKKGDSGRSKKPISVIIMGIVFVALIAVMLYFFVFRSNSSTLTYYDQSLVYTMTLDKGTAEERVVNGGKEFVIEDEKSASFTESVNADSEGELAYYLLHPETSSAKLTVIQSYESYNVIYLQGSYRKMVDSKYTTTYSFTATVTLDTYETYVEPIVRNVKVPLDSKGSIIADSSAAASWKLYYSDSSTYKYGIESSSNLLSTLLPILIEIGLIVVAMFFVTRMLRQSGGGGGNPMSGFVNNVARKESGTKVRFADVAGCDEVKAELVEVVDYFHSTDKYTRLGAKLPHGVLLVGPPGTGKTLLAKAVAGEASVPFYSISGSDFVEMYVGVGASRVRSLFKTAKQNAPCLIFIDEIDAVGRQRGTGLGGGNDEREQTLNELLVEMDGFTDNNGVIVMAATNRSDVLDPALTRPGRFDRTITVDLPDKNGRAAILKVHSRNKKLAAEVSFEEIATRTVGFSGADLANIMNDAAILAVRNNRDAITTADIDEAIDRAISGPAKKSHLEEAEKKQVAYHEAGHAVVGIFLPYSDKVQKITIVPRGRTGGHVLMTPEKDRFLMTKNQLLARITGYLGGRVSEEIFFGDVSTGASNDIEVATQIARTMVTEYGMSDLGPIQYEKPGGSVFLGRDYGSSQANYSTEIAFEIDKAIRKIIDDCHQQCLSLLNEHRADVELIAETLIANETITADQIQYLLENRKLPEVDEHKIEGSEVKNPKNIVLYPGFEGYYAAIDKILENNPSRLVITVANAMAKPLSENQFRTACKTGAADPSRIGMLFVDDAQASEISMTVESFAEHLESYAGVPVLLIKCDSKSLLALKSRYEN